MISSSSTKERTGADLDAGKKFIFDNDTIIIYYSVIKKSKVNRSPGGLTTQRSKIKVTKDIILEEIIIMLVKLHSFGISAFVSCLFHRGPIVHVYP